MKLIRSLAATLALIFAGAQAEAANILVVLSDENHLDLKDGKVFKTGFYLNELMQPVKAFLDAGPRGDLRNAEGQNPGRRQDLDRQNVFRRRRGSHARGRSPACGTEDTG